jgi:hypothetical protein
MYLNDNTFAEGYRHSPLIVLLQRSRFLVLNLFSVPWAGRAGHGAIKIPLIFCNAFRAGIICVFIVCLMGEATFAQNDMTARKRVLTERLDSIDLEKQLRKRRGESLEDLEKASDSIKDSITAIKGKMPMADRVAEAAADSGRPGAVLGGSGSDWIGSLQKFLPHTFFDWLVAIVGLVAIVSGIVLVAGIFGMVSKGFSKRKKPTAPPAPKTLHEIFPRSAALEAYGRTPKVPPRRSEEKDEAIETLRTRIKDSGTQDAQEAGVLATVDEFAAAAASSQPDLGGNSAKDPANLKLQVIRAAQAGLDMQEISRRFHISLDEVSLILRISRQGDRKPG